MGDANPMRWLFSAVALFSGAALAVQVGMNSELRVRIGHPLVAALFSFLVGTAGLVAYLAIARPGWPTGGRLATVPWWGWTGGLVGACYVATGAAYANRLGAASWLGLVVTGQVLASVALDHFGLVGFPVHQAGLMRLVGVALLLAGVVIVLRS
jgi:transporter family-2 protein